MYDYGISFEFEDYVVLENCVCWYFTGDKAIIDELFPNKYPEAVVTSLSIEKYSEDDWQVSISPTMKEDDCFTDYDWTDIELSMSTIKELVAKANAQLKGEWL